MADKKKDYPAGEKPLVVRRTDDGIRILSGMADELGLNTMFLHRGMKNGELDVVMTLHTTEGDVTMRCLGFAETEKPPKADGTPQDPHINWTDTRWELTHDGRGKSDG
jgi:hypothetical protein